MFKWTFLYVAIALVFYLYNKYLVISTRGKKHEVLVFEHGDNLTGGLLAYTFKGEVPLFTPLFVHIIDKAEIKEKREIKYVRVEYISRLSPVIVSFVPDLYIVQFKIQFPFLVIPYTIYAFN
ncbi:uncharacterized protein LOC142973899 [Anticarsia gemmatalis]|uniref:uncharacterized protein LOC142973899 n=1 Tax=Anticarsia gemmatalis TaxID=129554 RepID=UPI003F76E223